MKRKDKYLLQMILVLTPLLELLLLLSFKSKPLFIFFISHLLFTIIFIIVLGANNEMNDNYVGWFRWFKIKDIKWTKSNNKYYFITEDNIDDKNVLTSRTVRLLKDNTFTGTRIAEMNIYSSTFADKYDSERFSKWLFGKITEYEKQTKNEIYDPNTFDGLLTKEDKRIDKIDKVV